jgi:hypothetical protein
MEVGVLTPEEGILAIQTGILPNSSESEESQRALKSFKDKGMYQPLTGVKGDQAQGGRPTGTSAPKKKMSPVGASIQFSVDKLKQNLSLAVDLELAVAKKVMKKHKLKSLTGPQQEVVSDISDLIIANETPENWISKADLYINNPINTNENMVDTINEYAEEHQTSPYLASLLYHSRKME